MAQSPGGASFIAPDAEEIARIRAKHSFLKPLTVPANSYPGPPAQISFMGSWSCILVRDNLPDDVAYHLARSLHSIEAKFCEKLAQACETTAANTGAAAPDISFFFQAEDGIRDDLVTGVQTCALPISRQWPCSDSSMTAFRIRTSWQVRSAS